MTLWIDPGAGQVLEVLRRAGHKAYLVGGCVRDSLAGRTPQDWDICTSARPRQTMELFGPERCIPTGLQHGTVTVRQGEGLYEVTTFRVEEGYSDGRHPDRVSFVGEVEADLARRDFTINAMAYAPGEGLIDPFGGREDLLVHRLVRAVGDPVRRFAEDGLRILRLYRFGAREQLAVEPATGRAAIAERARLDCVSAERIWQELYKLLAAPRPGSWMPPEILGQVLPWLDTAGQPARYAASLAVVDALPPDPLVRLAALLAPAGPGAARQAVNALRCSRAQGEEVCALAADSALPLTGEPLRLQARRLLARMDARRAGRLLTLRRGQTGDEGFARLAGEVRRLEQEGACCRVGQLAVNGKDLLALGVRPGPGVGRLLEAALQQVIEEKLPNQHDLLLGWLKENL
ncbi:MAG TPA: tRNA nucleotidyltransferase [Candidatus Faecalibacterium avium]|nr:tRNA nucleotidyltransferase [Candidatus Faecalibacterium avium]